MSRHLIGVAMMCLSGFATVIKKLRPLAMKMSTYSSCSVVSLSDSCGTGKGSAVLKVVFPCSAGMSGPYIDCARFMSAGDTLLYIMLPYERASLSLLSGGCAIRSCSSLAA